MLARRFSRLVLGMACGTRICAGKRWKNIVRNSRADGPRFHLWEFSYEALKQCQKRIPSVFIVVLNEQRVVDRKKKRGARIAKLPKQAIRDGIPLNAHLHDIRAARISVPRRFSGKNRRAASRHKVEGKPCQGFLRSCRRA